MKKRLIVEVYFDPLGHYAGKGVGCYRARLRRNPGIHDAGSTAKEAFDNFLRTAKSQSTFGGGSGKEEDYEIKLT